MSQAYLSKAATLVLGFLFLSQGLAAQVEVKNGGDIVHCTPSADSIFSGPYVLDYLATYHTYSHDHEADIAYPINELVSMLTKKIPEVGKHLDTFVSQYESQIGGAEDPLSDYIWRGSNNSLIAIKDEELDLLGSLDKNCYADVTLGIVNLNQVVVRQDRSGVRGFIYNYDRRMLDTIGALPWQTSYLIVHEWLWNFVDRASSVREINAFLHSETAAKMDEDHLRYALANMGFKWGPLTGNLPGEIVEITIESSSAGIKRLRATPSPVIVGPTTSKVRFINRSFFKLEVIFPGSQVARKLLPYGDNNQSSEVIVELGTNFRFPGSIALEIQPMFDPLNDILLLDILR